MMIKHDGSSHNSIRIFTWAFLCGCIAVLALIPTVQAAESPSVAAFPGAEGYGAVTRGDHVTGSWSRDEVMSIYHCENVTIQWCMMTEACSRTHKFGGIWGSNYSTYHHNMFAHNISRNPRFASACGFNDFRNNVIYNWQHQSVYGGEASQGNKGFKFSTVNLIANYYKPGPGNRSNVKSRILDPSTRDGEADAGKCWVEDNYVVGAPEVTADNWKGAAKQDSYFRLSEPWDAMPIQQQTANEAYKAVLETVGSRRDSSASRIDRLY